MIPVKIASLMGKVNGLAPVMTHVLYLTSRICRPRTETHQLPNQQNQIKPDTVIVWKPDQCLKHHPPKKKVFEHQIDFNREKNFSQTSFQDGRSWCTVGHGGTPLPQRWSFRLHTLPSARGAARAVHLGWWKKVQATDLDVETPSLRSCVSNSPFEYEKKLQRDKKVFWFFWNSKNDLIPEPDFDPNLSNPPDMDSEAFKAVDGKPTELWLKARDKENPTQTLQSLCPGCIHGLAPCFLQRSCIIPSAPRHTRRHVFSLGCRCHAACITSMALARRHRKLKALEA